MPIATPNPKLCLTLRPNDLLSREHSWRLEDGYIRANTWNQDGVPITLGLWGPGDIITPAISEWAPCEFLPLSRVVVESCEPTTEEIFESLRYQLAQTATLLQINRVRPADVRLLRLLEWIGRRFGRVSSKGTTLSLAEMNLTHRNLADICGMTRVTVTKTLTRFRTEGLLVEVGEMDLLLPRTVSLPLPVRAMELRLP